MVAISNQINDIFLSFVLYTINSCNVFLYIKLLL